ncbi:MAG: RecX family transcriptional regulator [Dehalococcoidia bacterium]|nr:MAG: RecX family transcriptional regulator [Dehalococcoidia bacterium]
MTKITALSFSKGRKKKVNVSLDGKRAFSLDVDVAFKEKLKVGQEMSTGQIEALKKVDYQQQCYSAAERLLCYRPRSEYEMSRRLAKLGFDNNTIEMVFTKLKEQDLLNDIDFATFWRDTRQSYSPRSQWLTRMELKQKGVPAEIIDRVASNINDNDNAYNAAKKKAFNLKKTDYQHFRHKLGAYLKRRGFGYNVIIKTIERLWQERQESQAA